MTNAPFLLELLADRSLNVSAVALHFDPDDEAVLLELTQTPAFAALTAALPCLVPQQHAGRLSANARERLGEAGCRVVEDGMIESLAAIDPARIPPTAQWLAGRWYLTPQKSSATGPAASRSLELKLLQLVANDADTREIESVFRQDPVLSYHLLRLVNSIGINTGRQVSSFSQAILILGRQQLKRWLNLMLFSANRGDHRSSMLLAHVTVRARTMELLSKACGLDRLAQEMAFMAGMFSLLGALFAMPLADVLAPLNLGKALSAALLAKEGDVGRLLVALEDAENLDLAALVASLPPLGVTAADFSTLTVEAHVWMLGVIQNRQTNDNG